jgi:proline iminopeptidase
MTTSGQRTVVIDGVTQVYRVRGSGPVCLVHSGGPGVHSEYLRMPSLEKHLTMVYVDPIGTGESGLLPGGDYSPSRYAYFARGVLDDLGTPTAYFLGHSHGGFVALQFGIEHPDRLDGLILYDTVPTNNDEHTQDANAGMAAFVRRWPDRTEAVEAGRIWDARTAGTLEIADSQSYQRFLEGILPAYFDDYRRTIGQVGPLRLAVTRDPDRQPDEWDVRDQLDTINVPCAVIVGTHDFICPTQSAYLMNRRLPDSRLYELPDCGHFAHVEAPDRFHDIVVEFVASTELRKRT